MTAVVQPTRAVLPALLAAGAGTVMVGTSLADMSVGKAVSVPGVPYQALATAGRMLLRNPARAAAGRVGGGRGRS